MSSPRTTPALAELLTRRFAARSPFWSWIVFERVGGALAYLFARLGLPPAAPTLLGGVTGVTGAVLLGMARDLGDVSSAGGLLLLAYALDCSDGQLARATGTSSEKGAWLDVTTDATVTVFVSMSMLLALLGDGRGPASSLLIAGAFGASRIANLCTATVVRSGHGGMRLSGVRSRLRTLYTSLTDTPFVYVVISATRLEGDLLALALVLITALTFGQTLASATHHFASRDASA